MTEAAEKKPRGRPFSRTNQPSRGPRDELAEQDFGQLARKILTDPRAQRALLARARRGNLPAHVIKMLVENAAPEPEAPRDAPTTAEVAACLEASVPPFIQRLMYDHARGRLDDQGRPTGKPTKQKAKPAPEPDLAEDRPLAAAAARLRAQEATAPEPEFAGDTAEERQVVRAAEALDRLAAAKEAWDAHPWEDRAHRSECRRCRETWRREALA